MKNMQNKVICIRSFRTLFTNVKNHKIKGGTTWEMYYGTATPGTIIHLDRGANYADLTQGEFKRYFKVI